jgi:hypothetical protein
MKTQIIIEGYPLDITDDISLELTYNIDDVSDFGSKNTNYSKTIVIQGTQNNNKILNNLYELGKFIDVANVGSVNVNSGFIPSIGSQCVILYDNMQVFKGKFRLMAINMRNNNIEYECAVFGELGGFYYEMNKGGDGFLKRRLQDLPLEDLNHTWDLTNIQNSWTNRDINVGNGYYYPLIDYGNASPYTGGSAKKDFEVGTFRPAVYVKEFINRIFQVTGYTYECDFFDTDAFKRLVIPNNADHLYTNTKNYINRSAVNVYNNGNPIDFNNSYIFDTANFSILVANHLFQYIGTPTFLSNIELTYSYAFTQPLYVYDIDIAILVNGNIVASNNFSSLTPVFGDTLSGTLNIDIPLSMSDTIECQVIVNNGSPVSFDGYIDATFKLSQETASRQIVSYGSSTMLIASTYIPQNVPCADFFSSILKMFNLYVIEDVTTPKKLIIKPYVDFYLPMGDALDWSLKLDRANEIRLTPMGELNSKLIRFKYKQDKDYWNEQYNKKYALSYGDFTWDTQYEFATAENSVELIFSPTINYSPTGVEKHVATMYARDDNNNETNISTNVRILQTKNIPVSTWHIKHGGGNILATTNFPYAGMFDDPNDAVSILNWEVPNEVYYDYTGTSVPLGLFNAFYSQYFAEIGDANSMLLSAYFHLTPLDIRLLDFAKNIVIDGTTWRINKIDGFNPLTNETTKVELLKVIELIY